METTDAMNDDALAALIIEQPEESQVEAATEVEAQAEVEEAETPEVEAEDEAAEGSEELPVFTVKVNGEDKAVTLEELTRDYSGQAYIQEGMRKAAESRKEAETFAQTVQAEREALLQFVQEIQSRGMVQKPVQPDPDMAIKDPIKYVQEFGAYTAAAQEYQRQQAQLDSVTRQHAEREEAALDALKRVESEKLVAAIPELSDPEKGVKVQKSLISAGAAYGYSQDEISGVMDHRAIRVLHDAAKWQALQAGKDAATKKVAGVQPVLRPSAKPTAVMQTEKVRQRLLSSGKDEDLAALLYT